MSKHHDRLNKTRWRAARRVVLDRDGWRCTQCKRPGRLEVHHKRPLKDRSDEDEDKYDPDALVTLCRRCHFDAHRKPKTRAERDWEMLVNNESPA